jgi:asparagine synthase (glutamine-hydrolysing)
MSMAHSLEVRVPFLDASLADKVANTAASTKRYGDKGLLKEALSSDLPDAVLQREKTGFTFPLATWLADELESVVDDALSRHRLDRTPLDPDAVETVRREFDAGHCHWSRLWALVVLTLWIDEHLVEKRSALEATTS